MPNEYTVVIEQDEAGYYVAHVPALKGCWSQGKSEEEALANVREAIALWLEAEAERVRHELRPGQHVREVTLA